MTRFDLSFEGRLSYVMKVLAFEKRKIKRLRWYVKSSTFPSSLNENAQVARFLIKSKILHHENDRNNRTFSWGLLCNVIILRKTLVKILKICSFRLDRHCLFFKSWGFASSFVSKAECIYQINHYFSAMSNFCGFFSNKSQRLPSSSTFRNNVWRLIIFSVGGYYR